MAVVVLSRRGFLLPQFVANPAGNGLLARVRALSFALLGLTTAVGLGLVAFISQIGWPDVLGGPIPGFPADHGAVHNRVVAARPAGPLRGLTLGAGSQASVGSTPSGAAAALRTSGLSGSNKASAPSPSKPSHDGDQPSGHGTAGGQPGAQPPAGAPAPVPVSIPVPPASSSPPNAATAAGSPRAPGKSGEAHGRGEGHSEGKGYSKVHGPSTAKASSRASHAPPVPAKPPAPDAGAPSKDVPSIPSDDASGHGHGHAYGHSGT
jgi:hypothetical protein